MHTKLLNLGFTLRGDTYICEHIRVQIRGDLLYVFHLDKEVSLDELEQLLLKD